MEHQTAQKILNKLNRLSKSPLKTGSRFLGIAAFLFILMAIGWSFFSSEAALQELLAAMGPHAPVFFVFIQILQTVTPFVPAALIIPVGLLLFGVSSGFFLSFLGLTIGSAINFKLARSFGRPFVERFVSKKQLDQYTNWLADDARFDRLFALGMFLPFTPSDFLCYLAGLSDISFKKYLSITSLSKIFTLFLYTYGLLGLIQLLLQIFA